MENTPLEDLEDELFLLFVRGEITQDQMHEKINNLLEGNTQSLPSSEE